MKKAQCSEESTKKILPDWLGRQNIFVVLFVIFSMFFIGSRISTALTIKNADQQIIKSNRETVTDTNSDNAGWKRPATTSTTSFTSAPSFKPSPSPTITPIPSPTPKPTPSPEQLFTCQFPKDSECSNYKETVSKLSDCEQLRCCKNYEKDEFVVDNLENCEGFYQSEINKQNQKQINDLNQYAEKVEANIQNNHQDICEYMLEANNVQNQNLESCRNWVSNNYSKTVQVGVGPPQNNKARSEAWKQCSDLYGTAPFPEANESCK